MKEFKCQKFIATYQLDESKFPAVLTKAIEPFSVLSDEKVDSEEAKNLLEELDDRVCLMLLEWVKKNADNLEEIVCSNCKYKDFYTKMFDELIKYKDSKEKFVSQIVKDAFGEPLTFTFHFLKDLIVGDCSYYQLFSSWEAKVQSVYIFKVCHSLKTMELIYRSDHLFPGTTSAYDYSGGKPLVDWQAKKLLDAMTVALFDGLEMSKIKFQPIINMPELMKKLKIAKNV